MNSYLTSLLCSILLILELAFSHRVAAATRQQDEALIAYRKAISKGQITFVVTTVETKWQGRPTTGDVNRIRITFLNNLFKSETLKGSQFSIGKSVVGRDFVLSSYADSTIPSYKKLSKVGPSDTALFMVNPRLLGLKLELFMNLGLDGFRSIIGRADVSEIASETRDIGMGQQLNVTVDKMPNGALIKTAYNAAGQLIMIETVWDKPPMDRLVCTTDIVNTEYGGVKFPKQVSYKRTLKKDIIEYHEIVVVEEARFDIPVSEADFLLDAQLPKGTEVLDRSVGSPVVIDGGNSIGLPGLRKKMPERSQVRPDSGRSRWLIALLIIATAALFFAIIWRRKKPDKKPASGHT